MTAASITPDDSPEPRYAAIKKHVLDAIGRGDLRPGDRVESEAELIRRFGVSRMTANRALRELQDLGVLTRVAGSGSFVSDPSAKGHIIEIRNIADEVVARGHVYGAKVIRNVAMVADKRTGALLDVPAGTPLFHSVIVHLENGLPIQLEERFVLGSAAPGYDKADFHTTTPHHFLMQSAPLGKVDHSVRAVRPTADEARLLEMGTDEPCLLLIRRTWSQARLVSHARLTHPGGRYQFEDSFTV